MFLAVQTTCSQTTTWRKRERSPDFADEYCDVDEFSSRTGDLQDRYLGQSR